MGALILCIIALIFGVIILVVKSFSPNKVPTPRPQAIITAQPIVRHTSEEILAQAQSQESIYLLFDIEQLPEDELIDIATRLNKTQLRRWFKHHHDDIRFHFPLKAYAFIESKLNNQVWFTDEQFAARQAAGKPTTYITENDMLIEEFEDIFYRKDLTFDDKIEVISELLKGKSKKFRLNRMMSYFDLAYEHVKSRNTDQDLQAQLRSIKNKQTRAYNNLKLNVSDVNLEVLDKCIRLL